MRTLKYLQKVLVYWYCCRKIKTILLWGFSLTFPRNNHRPSKTRLMLYVVLLYLIFKVYYVSGGAVVDSANTCSVLVTDKVRRTVKFLCAVGQGKPIVTPHWIAQSWKCCRFEGLSKLTLNKTFIVLLKFLIYFP